MLTKIIPLKIFLIFILCFSSSCYASSLRSVTFDDIREEGGFESSSLLTVSCIQASDTKLTPEEKKALTKSKNLKNVHSLYLPNQDLDDNFISELCKNPSLKRLISLDLSQNSNITTKSLQIILESELGSVRDLPQISGKYGIPSSTIYVNVKKTAIQSKPTQGQIILERLGFNINYKNPITKIVTDTPVDYAVKFVESNGA